MLNYRTQTYNTQQAYVDAVINIIAGFEGHDANVKKRADLKATTELVNENETPPAKI